MENPAPLASRLGGFEQSGLLLEFDQIRGQLASYTRTVLGRELAHALTPTRDLLEIAAQQQETTESRRFLDEGGTLEFGPDQDFRQLLQRALLGGLLRGAELFAIRELARAARNDRSTLSRHPQVPALSGLAEDIPDLGYLDRESSAAISPAGEVRSPSSPEPTQRANGTKPAAAATTGGGTRTPDHPT